MPRDAVHLADVLTGAGARRRLDVFGDLLTALVAFVMDTGGVACIKSWLELAERDRSR